MSIPRPSFTPDPQYRPLPPSCPLFYFVIHLVPAGIFTDGAGLMSWGSAAGNHSFSKFMRVTVMPCPEHSIPQLSCHAQLFHSLCSLSSVLSVAWGGRDIHVALGLRQLLSAPRSTVDLCFSDPAWGWYQLYFWSFLLEKQILYSQNPIC